MTMYQVCWGDETCSSMYLNWHTEKVDAKTVAVLVKYIQAHLSNGYVLLQLDEVVE